MKKDAYYFSHFSNARHDRKLKRVRKELGVEGYGIYFMILEVLRDQADFKYPIKDIDLLADEFGTSVAKINAIINSYDLFIIVEEFFISIKFIFYLQPYIEKTERARNASIIRWNKVKENNNDAFALQMQSPSNADAMQGKERKGKNRIGEDRKPDHPTLNSVFEYLKENGAFQNEDQLNKSAQRFHDSLSGKSDNDIEKWEDYAKNWLKKEIYTKEEPKRKRIEI